MKLWIAAAATAGLFLSGPVRADDGKSEAHDALDAQAKAPTTPPTLPDSASARAKFVQENIAHGKKGAEEKAKHAHQGGTHDGDADTDAARHAQGDADSAKDDAANKSAKGAAASAAKSANADSHAAAGQARAQDARGGPAPGSGKPSDPGSGNEHH